MKRVTRDRRLTPDEAAKYRTVREQVAAELPDLVARHHERMAALDQLDELLRQLKAAREEKGLTNVAIIRLEQLYPFHEVLARKILDRYKPELFAWVQEEALNNGAWFFV